MIELFGLKETTTEIVEEKKGKETNIFTYLTDIMTTKKGDVHIKNDPNMSKFNTFRILRFLSLDEGYLPFINVINTFQDILTKEEAYKLLITTIPRSRKYLKFPKKTNEGVNDEDCELVAKYFQCPKHEAEEFIKLNLVNVEKVKLAFGGKK